MLGNLFRPPLTELDVEAFKAYVPADHFVRKALRVIPWESFEGKLEYLRYQYQLSDRQVILRAQTDIAFRCFLQVARHHPLPDPSSLCRFRGRLGEKGFREIFDRVVGIARQNGLVKDRLRIKDATEAYAQVRAEHPQVERKLGEIMNCHSGRRAWYRGSGKVFIQQLMACTATNVKRIVKLVCAPEVALTCEH